MKPVARSNPLSSTNPALYSGTRSAGRDCAGEAAASCLRAGTLEASRLLDPIRLGSVATSSAPATAPRMTSPASANRTAVFMACEPERVRDACASRAIRGADHTRLRLQAREKLDQVA